MLQFDGQQQIVEGNDPKTTNNRMELMAAIKGLEAAPPDQAITLYSDSTYLDNTMTKGWKRKANHDLWERLDELSRQLSIDWKWVKAHQGTPGNELADSVASNQANLA